PRTPERRQPQLRLLVLPAGPDHVPPDPGHEVAPVVEVPVGDDDGVDKRPAAFVELPQPRQHAGAAIEEQPPRIVLHEVAGLRAAGVRPRRGTPDDSQFHVHILTEWSERSAWSSRSRVWTGTTGVQRSSPAPSATPEWRSST